MQLCCNLRKALLLVIILVHGTSLLSGQPPCNLIISGKVLDETGKPLPGATIWIKELHLGLVSTAEGTYSFTQLCPGTYSLEFKFLGFETQQRSVDLVKSEWVDIRLLTTNEILEEVVISDHREVVSKGNNFSTLSAKQLDEVKGRSLGETLQGVTGVTTIQTGPAIFKPVIHGVHSQRILILNNGIRQEGQQWGAEHAPEIDPFIATNLVVIKDAGAIKYGTDAIGGVVVVTPAELPADQPIGGDFHLIGNSNGRAGIVSGLLEGSILKSKGWGWRVQGTSKTSGDSHAADYNLSNTGFRELNYSASTGYHKENKGFEIFYSHFNTTIGILRGASTNSTEDLENAFEREPPQYTEDFTYAIDQPRQEVSHDLVKLNGHIRNGKNLFNLQYGFQYNNREEYDVRRGSLKEVPALGYKLFTQTLDFEWETTLRSGRSRSRGINGMWQDNNKIDGTQTIPFIPNFTNYSGGLFWIEKISTPRWDWDFGARYDYRYYEVAGFDFKNELYRSTLSFGNASAAAGATFKLNRTSSLTSNLGSTWRPPNVAELYSLGTHQSAAAIEYGLLLDETTNEVLDLNEVDFKLEQALKWVNTYRMESGPWQVELSGYLNYIYNYIYLKPRGVTQNTRGVFPYFRYSQTNASFLGADFMAHYTLTTALTVKTKISLLRAADETQEDYLIFIPSNRAEVSFRYQLDKVGSWKDFYVDLTGNYVARQNRAPRVVPIEDIIDAKEMGVDILAQDPRNFDFLPPPEAYFLLGANLGISKPIHNSLLHFRISIQNALNESYREYTNRMRYYADDLGRNVTIALKYSF